VNTLVGGFNASRAGYTVGKVPASVAGDAVTFLSDKFNTLAGNPFAPVGQLATVNVAAGNEILPGNQTWGAVDTDYVVTAGSQPASPAPCSNLLRELLLRRRTTVPNAADNFPHVYAPAAVARDWRVDLRAAAPTALFDDDSRNGVLDGAETALTADRLMNAFVAYAPLESFVDLDLFLDFNTSNAAFSTRNTPTARNDREAVRDWMRCTLNSRHHLADNNSVAAITYSGTLSPTAVLMPPVQPQRGTVGAGNAMVSGMLASGGAAFDVTYRSILGSNGFAPVDTTALFTTGSDVIFTRDRSALIDPNGQGVPSVIDPALANLPQAANGDQLAINLSILTGTTWSCPQDQAYPSYGVNHIKNDSYTVTGNNANWTYASLDEGIYGIFRFQESWAQLSNAAYIDFFVNGSVVAMFYSREANGKHILNQGFMPNMFSACGGQDLQQTRSRDCRLNPGFEYAWESARRSITYDPSNDGPGGLAPGAPLVVDTDRLRWVRR
jgi:hypothetical protein